VLGKCGGGTLEYSDDLITWYPAHSYQSDIFHNNALPFFRGKKNDVFYYNNKMKGNNNIEFNLIPINKILTHGRYLYIILKNNNTKYGYFKFTPDVQPKTATEEIQGFTSSGEPSRMIEEGKGYYISEIDPNMPLTERPY
jgi:hypothetical protein